LKLIIIIAIFFQLLFADENSINIEPITVEAEHLTQEYNNYSKHDLEARDIDSLDDLSAVLPSFSVSNYGSRNVAFTSYRGQANFMTTTSPVAIYIDDIPLAYVNTFLTHELYNISDVNILKGPQGFTTGLGAQAGIIQLKMDDKLVKEAEFSSEVKMANYAEKSLVLHSKTPIEDGTIAIDTLYKQRDGFTKNLYDNKSLDDEETKALSVRMIKNIDNLKLTFLGLQDFNNDGGTPYHDNLQTPFVMNQNVQGYIRQNNLLSSIKLEYFANDYVFKSVSSFHNYRSKELLDGDRTPENFLTIDIDENYKEFTEELSMQIQKSGWELTSGLFFASRYEHTYTENHHYEYLDTNGYRIWQTSQPEKSFALFSEYAKNINENIILTAALRYTWNEKDFNNNINQSFPIEVAEYGFLNTAYPHIIATSHWQKVLPKVKIAYKQDNANLIFLQYAEAFKNGGYSYDDYDIKTLSYDPEESKTLELGFNTKWKNSLNLSATLYATHVDKLQVETIRSDLSSYIDNAAKADIYGIESELRYLFNNNFSVHSCVGFIHSKFDDYISNSNNYSGNQLINVPQHTFQFGSEFSFSKNYYLDLVLKSNGKTYFDKANTVSESSYTYVDTKMGYKSKKFSWNVYIHNLFDKRYLNYIIAAEGFNAYNFGEPRRIGVSLKYDF
jgi:iron complex outermembrane receptor protein